MPMIDLAQAQAELAALNLDGWLLYDFQGLNPLARGAAGLGPEKFLTRRWFCLVPRRGEPRWLVHAIERAQFEGVPGEIATFARRSELEAGLRALVGAGAPPGHAPRIAMEYSPAGNVPIISRIDGGTIEMVRTAGAQVASSGDLVQALLARWTARGRESHGQAARAVEGAIRRAFEAIGDQLRAGRHPTEVGIQRRILSDLEEAHLVSNSPPIVAVNAHAADPHYSPGGGPGHDAPIQPRAVVMLDVWAKLKDDPEAVYADITFMGFVGDAPPPRVEAVWRTVAGARDAALARAQSAFRAGQPVRGFEVDRAARAPIEEAGFGPFFTHRTGHSLGTDDHFIGANMDDFETHDDRLLVAGTGFTIEPGIYLPGEFGVRSEIDVFVDAAAGPVATTEVQKELVRIRAGSRCSTS